MLKIDSAELTFAIYCMYVRRRQHIMWPCGCGILIRYYKFNLLKLQQCFIEDLDNILQNKYL